jgi:hypothetical protein
MPRLKDRTKNIPYGFKWIQPQTKWEPYPHSSFKTVVDGLVQHRRANPGLGQKYGWKTAWNEVADEVDLANALNMQRLGHTAYIIEDSNPVTAVPKAKARPQPSRSVKNAAVGANLLKDWLGDGAVPVPDDVAAKRAWTCTAGAPGGQRCPQNTQGNWMSYFTVPASEGIRKMLSLRSEKALTTPSDESLGVCTVCDCPLKLKVHVTLDHIKKHTTDEVRASFPDFCWIKAELAAAQ